MGETGQVKALPLLLAAALLAACSSGSGPAVQKAAYHGVEPTAVVKRPSFVLTDLAGEKYDFSARTKGRPTFVYFGYTHCPDACPTAMADIATALRKVPADLARKAIVVFVTTDPKRDTVPVMKQWLGQFSAPAGTAIVGLVGTPAELDAAQRAAGVEPAYPDGVTPTLPGHPDQHVTEKGTAPHKHFGPLGYAVTHSAAIFAYDAADHLPVLYPGGVTPSDIAADLPVLAKA